MVMHTWGPWMANGLTIEKGSIWKAEPIAQVLGPEDAGPEELQANARLIAAAPDLLSAIKALVWQAENHEQTVFGMALEDARAAIRNAEGE